MELIQVKGIGVLGKLLGLRIRFTGFGIFFKCLFEERRLVNYWSLLCSDHKLF